MRKKTHVCLRNACARIQVTKFPQDYSARIERSKDVFFTVKRGSVQSGTRRRLEEIVDCIIELDVYERGKELGNDVTYF